MYFTRSGKNQNKYLGSLSLSPICAVQKTAIEQILNIPVKDNIIWEGFTSRFIPFDIPTNVHLTDVATELKNSNDSEIVETRRFIKKNSRQEASPVLITILGINTPGCVKLWFFNHRTQLFIDNPRQCNYCYSFPHSSRFFPVMFDVLIVEDPILDNVQTLQIAQTVKETIQQTPPIVSFL
ncbi:putative RNA-directed DNA polymerase from transposon X-element [Trichonephila clavipes]|nr:putative RNA-directed DNA polymerase from transposon X-element [Trichonephila clavipes]